MSEVYNNDASTSLVSAIGASDTSITVVSSQQFNTTGTFRIRIDDEIMTVTGVAGNVWTVTRAAEVCEGSQVATTHAANAAVYGVLTVASLIAGFSGGSGTVTTVSVVSANGVSGVVANPTTTPAITISLGAITPTTVVASGNISSGGNIGASGTILGSNISGTNTGDQTITLTGDVTGTGVGSFAATVGANKISYSKIQQESASTLLGNPTGGAANPSEITLGSGLAFTGSVLNTTNSGAGTVTSVAVTVPAGFTSSGSPITSSGTIAIGLSNESANTVWAGPTSGGAAAPTFRTLTTADMPSGTGTVTSVGLSLPVQFTVTNSPVTTTGTLTATLAAPMILADGSQAFTANQSLGSNKLTNVTDPTGAQDVATKNYVDTQIGLLTVKKECQGATVVALAASTYANGSSGVGATITLTVAATLVLDGYTPVLNDRLLIKNQADPTENGIYTLTTLGVALGAQAVLTRATDFNQPTNGINGAFVFIQNGTINAKTGWLCSAFGTIVFGHGGTAINWVQDTGSGTYTGTSPIAVSASNVISLNVPVPTTLGGLGADTSGYSLGQIPIAQGDTTYAADSRRGLYSGTGAPAGGLGFPGDYYIDLASNILYLKS